MHTPPLAAAVAGLLTILAAGAAGAVGAPHGEPIRGEGASGWNARTSAFTGSAAPVFVPPTTLQERGAALARELGCGACHAGVPDASTVRERAPLLGPGAAPLDADFVFTYLADPVRRRDDIGASRMPDFRLDEGERVALASFLAASASGGGAFAAARDRHPGATADVGRRIWGVLGCAACHGPADGTGASGAGTGRPAADAADAATPSVGPDLSREGVRVRPGWLRAYLAQPGPIRAPAHPSSPGSRMPDFRLTDAEAEALTAWLQALGQTREEAPAGLSVHEADRTRRMLDDRVACLGCHVVDGRGGGIGPSLEAVAARLRPGFVAEMVADPAAAAPGAPMPRQRMPAREARRLARLVLDAGDAPWRPGPQPSLADPDHPAWAVVDAQGEGAALYARHCAACHGTDGRGAGWNARSLPVPPAVHADPEAMGARPDDTLYDGIAAGAWVLDGSARMAPFRDLLSPAEIRALVAHIRTLCDCAGPAWAGDGREGA